MTIAAETHRPFTGRDLAAERVRRGLRAADVAKRLGVSRGRITTMEQRIEVPDAFADRYFTALGIVDTR